MVVTVKQGHLFVTCKFLCKFKALLAPELALILLYLWQVGG